MPKHIILISDLNMGGADSAEQAVPRSGYANISLELCRRLVKFGHEVIILGLGYTGQEHENPFTIVPCNTLHDAEGYMNNLKFMWNAEVVIVALDIHHYQERIFPTAKKLGLKYICITPLESDPLCITWANLLRGMDKVFFISQFGADEAQKAGVEAEHIEIGIDTDSWRMRTQEEYEQIRKSLGYEPDDFVVMTVADNQERKALGRGFQILAALKLHGVNIKHILVTREHSTVGWRLYDLGYEVLVPSDLFPNQNFDAPKDEYGNYIVSISSDLKVFNNGIPFADLYALYCGADAYLSCSKGEGLGLPVMEAMSVGVPVVANRTGALPELLADMRGWIVDWKSWYYDPFGNQKRYDIDIEKAVEALKQTMPYKIATNSGEYNPIVKSRKFMESKSWDKSAQQIEDALKKIFENES